MIRYTCKSGEERIYYNETGLSRRRPRPRDRPVSLVWALLPTRMARKNTIPHIEERLSVGKRSVVSGRVRVRKTVRKRRQTLDIALKREEVVVRRVPVNRVVPGPVAVRRQGSVTIVPVLEEVPVVTTQLVLKEELHIETRASRVGARREVVLRSENVEVTRDRERSRPRSQ